MAEERDTNAEQRKSFICFGKRWTRISHRVEWYVRRKSRQMYHDSKKFGCFSYSVTVEMPVIPRNRHARDHNALQRHLMAFPVCW